MISQDADAVISGRVTEVHFIQNITTQTNGFLLKSNVTSVLTLVV
jgi:hypothetical protein